MAGKSGVPELVVGKLDTGASRTMLNFNTAKALGIDDPMTSFLSEGTAYAANDSEIQYYVHRVIAFATDSTGREIRLVLKAGFSDDVKRNLFGVDWLDYVCIAVDKKRIHLLAD